MSRICYYLSHGFGEWTSISKDDKSILELSFTPAKDGYIKLKDTVYRVRSGELSIPIYQLSDGSYELRLDTDGEGFALEGFTKCGDLITMNKTAESTLRALLAKNRKNDERLRDLEEKISILIKRTEGHHIFN